MATSIPTSEPERFVQGDTVSWTKSLLDYLPADGWTLHYAFVLIGQAAIVIDGTDNGDGSHLIEITPEESADFALGSWESQAYVTKGTPVTERVTLFRSTTIVDPDFATQTTGYDGRSWARRMLDYAEAAIEETVANRFPVAGYSFSTGQGSRSVTIRSYQELKDFRSQMRAEVRTEERAQARAAGKPSGGKILTRFTS